MPPEVAAQLLPVADAVRDIYLHPDVTSGSDIAFGRCDAEGVVRFLCDERAFSRERVAAALERAFGSG